MKQQQHREPRKTRCHSKKNFMSGRSDTRGLRTPGVYATYSFHRASTFTVEILIYDTLPRPTDTLHRWRGCYVVDCQMMSTGESSAVQHTPKKSLSEEQSRMTVSPTLHFYKITFPQPLTPPCQLTLRTSTKHAAKAKNSCVIISKPE